MTNNRIAELSDSLTDMSAQVSSNSAKIIALQKGIEAIKKQPVQNIDSAVRSEVDKQMAASKSVLDDQLRMMVNKKMGELNKEVDKVKVVQAVQAQTNEQLADIRGRRPGVARSREDFEAKYWKCRRSIRLWPIDCSSESTMWAEVGNFFSERLQIPHDDLPQEEVEAITRVLPGRRKKKIENEVIVRLKSVQIRDMIVSYAPNLRAWREQDGSGRAATGLRLEIPDHLMAVFKTLERYGFHLKEKYKEGLRRHSRYDDMNMSLVMDFALPEKEKWQRIDFENAREELRMNGPAPSTFPRFSSSSAADVADTPRTWAAPSGQGVSDGAEQEKEVNNDGMDQDQ